MTAPKDQRPLSNFVLEQYTDLGTLLHLSALLERGHKHVVLRELERHAPDSVLPERAVVLRTIQGMRTGTCLPRWTTRSGRSGRGLARPAGRPGNDARRGHDRRAGGEPARADGGRSVPVAPACPGCCRCAEG